MGWIERYFGDDFKERYTRIADDKNDTDNTVAKARMLAKQKPKIVLGSGDKTRDNAVNVDITKYDKVDLIWDLEIMPWPFEDNSFDEVWAEDIIEHVDDPFSMMEEIYRVCKDGAKVHIVGPHFMSANLPADLTHKRGFNERTFDHFDHSSATWQRYKYTNANFKILKAFKDEHKNMEFTLKAKK